MLPILFQIRGVSFPLGLPSTQREQGCSGKQACWCRCTNYQQVMVTFGDDHGDQWSLTMVKFKLTMVTVKMTLMILRLFKQACWCCCVNYQ